MIIDIIQQAKAMEKEQIITVYWDAYNEGKYSTDKTAEEYYKETFIT
jgi:HEPN domain-containing protein